MKRSQQVMDSLLAEMSAELSNSLITESVEELESQISAKDIEIAVLNTRLADIQTQLSEEETECERLSQFEVKCANLDGTLFAERNAWVKLESDLREQIRQLQAEDIAEDIAETKVVSIKVNRSGDGLTRNLELIYA